MTNKHKEAVKELVVNTDILEVEETLEEADKIVEGTPIEDPGEETVVESDEEPNDNNTHIRANKMGKVVNCVQLNVRAEADLNSEIISILNVNSEVIINDPKSNRLFYKISTSAGIEGFCMKAYISR